MPEPLSHELPKTMNCGHCEKQIPIDEAIQEKGRYYILYFCGPKCQQEWHKNAEKEFS